MTYRVIDSGNFSRLEQVGPYRIVRPSLNSVWSPSLPPSIWDQWDAKYERYSGGRGEWHIRNSNLESPWQISLQDQIYVVKLTDFGHLGLFAEHATKFGALGHLIDQASPNSPKLLSLFAYTGAFTVYALKKGAEIVHLDASKASVAWAKENAVANYVDDKPVRWIIDDARKFVQREVKRGSRYHGVVLDPPSFGRGKKGEVWKNEDHLVPLLADVFQILDENFGFVLLSSHSAGYGPQALKNLLLPLGENVSFEFGELVVESEDGRPLPSGSFCLASRNPK